MLHNPPRAGVPCVYVLAGAQPCHFGQNAFAGCGAAVLEVTGADWFRDFSPWPSPRLSPGDADFGGGARAYLDALTRFLVQAEKREGLAPASRFAAGYSLAGLFALYALTQSDFFSGAASVSGSLWYDGWTEFLQAAPLPCTPAFVYLSLGRREADTRRARICRIAECTENTARLLAQRGIPVQFEWNPGGHFNEPDARLARAVDALVRHALC